MIKLKMMPETGRTGMKKERREEEERVGKRGRKGVSRRRSLLDGNPSDRGLPENMLTQPSPNPSGKTPLFTWLESRGYYRLPIF